MRLPWRGALVSAFCLLAATNGPAVTLSVHVLDRGFAFEDWPFNVPIWIAIAVGIWRLAWRTRVGEWWGPRWNLVLVAALPAWMLFSGIAGDATITSNSRALVTVGLFAFAVSFAFESFVHQVLATFLAANTATLASALLILWKPHLGRSTIDQFGNGDYFQGIFANRNSLGPVCALAIIAAAGIVVLRLSPVLTWAAIALLPVNLWLLVGSHSVTPMLGLAAAVAVAIAAVLWQRSSGRERHVLIGGYAVVILLLLAVRDWLFDLIGRDSGLSDRTSIWSDVIDIVDERPLVGHGYWAFWDSDQAWPLYARHGGFQFGSAHNSMLEMALGNGWIGGALFLAIVLTAVVRVAVLVDRAGVMGVWWASLLAFMLVEHATESFVLYHSYLFVLLVSAACLSCPPGPITDHDQTPDATGRVLVDIEPG